MKLKPRTLSLNNVVSCTLEMREGDELLEIIDGTVDFFAQVLVDTSYYLTGPMVFCGHPEFKEFSIMTTLGNQVRMVEDGAGFDFREHVEVQSDFFYRHWDVEEPIPYQEIEHAVADAGLTVKRIYHVILDFYGDTVLDLYVEAESR